MTDEERDKIIEFKAEVKSDLKYLRIDMGTLQRSVDELILKVNSLCTDIAVMKAKTAIYSAFIGAAASIIVALIVALVKG